jgi:hypothetical protein
MASDEQDTFANREAPIPVLQVHPADDSTPKILTPSTEHGHSRRLSASKLKDKLESLGDKSGRDSAGRMGDKMFNLYVHRSLHVYPTSLQILISQVSSHKSFPPRISQTIQTAMMHLRQRVSRTGALALMLRAPTSPFPPCHPTSDASTPA